MTTTPVKPKPKPKPKPKSPNSQAQARRDARAQTRVTAHARATTAATPAAPIVAAAPPNSGGDLARTLLLALAILFLILALLPWRRFFDPYMAPDQAVRFRVAFIMISLSVGFGYVIAVYLNGVV